MQQAVHGEKWADSDMDLFLERAVRTPPTYLNADFEAKSVALFRAYKFAAADVASIALQAEDFLRPMNFLPEKEQVDIDNAEYNVNYTFVVKSFRHKDTKRKIQLILNYTPTKDAIDGFDFAFVQSMYAGARRIPIPQPPAGPTNATAIHYASIKPSIRYWDLESIVKKKCTYSITQMAKIKQEWYAEFYGARLFTNWSPAKYCPKYCIDRVLQRIQKYERRGFEIVGPRPPLVWSKQNHPNDW